jgi:hypothetical protein
MNINSAFIKKNLIKKSQAFNELEKIRFKNIPKNEKWILNQSNNSPSMANVLRDNNAFEDEFWRTHNSYKFTPHIDYKPKYTPPYYAPEETGYGSFDYKTYKENLKMI